MTPTTRCGCPAPGRWPAGSTPRCSTRPATRRRRSGWFPFVLDTNGNGKLDEFTEPDKPEEGKDTRFNPGSGPYAVMPHPTDGSIWYTSGVFGGTAGLPALRSEDQAQRVLCAAEGSHRPARRRHRQGRRAVGLRLGRPSDRASTGASARRRSTGRTPPAITARRASRCTSIRARASTTCRIRAPRRATTPGSITTTRSGSATNVPISTANLQDGFVALQDGKMVLMRVPYPMGFYAKGLDARIDDPNAGWKGRGLWSASGDRTPWLNELGKGARPMAVHIQVRPDPLAQLNGID